MTIDLTPVLQAIIALLATLVTYKLIPWIKSKTTETTYENLMAAAKVAVFAAEQIYKVGNGDQKLAYAIESLEKAGFHLDETTLRNAIEKAVNEMNFDRQRLTSKSAPP